MIDRLRKNTLPHGSSAPPDTIPSAVLIPIITAGETPMMILTKRSPHLTHHGGQIGFPGGRIEHGENISEAALREAQEEIGLSRDQVEIIGFLEGVMTSAGFHIAPVLGLIDTMPEFIPSPYEVERIITIPLAAALDRENYRVKIWYESNVQRQTYIIKHHDETIWGATARIIMQWQALLTRPAQSVIARGG